MFTGRDRPRSSQDGSAHGTPGRMDGQPRGRPDGITSHEEKKHYHDGNVFFNYSFIASKTQRRQKNYTEQIGREKKIAPNK